MRTELVVQQTLFDEMVADHRMPKAVRVGPRTIWDRVKLDMAFSELPTRRWRVAGTFGEVP